MGKTTMNGTEQVLFENTELGEYNGYVYLDKMVSGDKIRVRVYLKDKEDDTYKLRDSKDFENAQSTSAIGFLPCMSGHGFKVTAQQIAGAMKDVTYKWFKR